MWTLLLTSVLTVASATAATPHDPDARRSRLDARIAARPFDAALYVQRAALLLGEAEPVRALLDFERAAELAPHRLDAAVGRARALFALGRDQDALWCLDAAEALGADAQGLAWLRGRVLESLGRRDAAAAALRTGLEHLAPRRPEHFLQLAQLLDDADAGRLLDRGLDELGPVPALVTAAVERDLRRGLVDTALLRLDEVMAHAARKAPWLRARAAILADAGRHAEAEVERARAARSDLELAQADAHSAPALGPPPPARNVAVPLVAAGSEWRFCDRGAVAADWRELAFDDARWSVGRGQIGYGDGDEGAIAEFGADPRARHAATWFRRRFTVDADAAFTWARLRLLRDDGAAVWLDGREIARSNLPPGPLDAATLALEEQDDLGESTWHDLRIDPALLTPGPHVLAVAVHQHRRSSSDLSFDCQLLAGRATAPVTRGPYLQNGTPDGAVLRWRTALPSATQVWIGASPASLQLAFTAAALATEHTAALSGLQAETRYYYAVGDATGVLAGGDQDHWFETLPPAGAVRPLRAWVLGDCGTADATATAVRDACRAFVGADRADVVLMLGDNAYPDGTDAQYQAAVFDMYPEELRNTFTWSTLGNHDQRSASSATQSGVYYDVFDLPTAGQAGGLPSGTEAYYAFDRGHVHFVCLDSQDSDRTAGGAMLQWLQADLASTSAPFVVAFFHHPPYTKGTHDSDNTGDSGARMYDMRRNALPILEQHGVDLVLSGHSHTYERSYLLDGAYGFSVQMTPANFLDLGDGRPDGDGSYAKAAATRGSHDGAVYVTAGSAGQSGGGSLDHPAMFVSLPDAGSLLVDVDGDRLTGTFVTATGAVLDTFALDKNLHRMLRRDVPVLSVGQGGTQAFALDAGPAFANRFYILGGALDTQPGFQLGAFRVPLNPDAWFSTWAGLINSPVYPNSLGQLDAAGRASAAFVLPPNALPGGAGLSVYHAFAVWDANGPLAVSNAVRVRFEQ
ncbi:MAG: metallophosphoesterase [Planctomycetota bacterium]